MIWPESFKEVEAQLQQKGQALPNSRGQFVAF